MHVLKFFNQSVQEKKIKNQIFYLFRKIISKYLNLKKEVNFVIVDTDIDLLKLCKRNYDKKIMLF